MNAISRQVRRQAQRSATGRLPVVGFQPVHSQWLANLVTRKLIEIATQIEQTPPDMRHALGLPATMAAAQEEAQRRAARDLPAPRMVRSHVVKPSKSDDPAYRNPALRRAA